MRWWVGSEFMDMDGFDGWLAKDVAINKKHLVRYVLYLRPRHDTNNLSELLSFNFGLVEVNCYKFRGEFCCQTVVVLAELPDLSARNRKETVSKFFSRSHANHPSLRQQQHPFKSFHVQGCHYHFFSRS